MTIFLIIFLITLLSTNSVSRLPCPTNHYFYSSFSYLVINWNDCMPFICKAMQWFGILLSQLQAHICFIQRIGRAPFSDYQTGFQERQKSITDVLTQHCLNSVILQSCGGCGKENIYKTHMYIRPLQINFQFRPPPTSVCCQHKIFHYSILFCGFSCILIGSVKVVAFYASAVLSS